MSDKRRMVVSVNLLVTADIESENGNNHVGVVGVTHHVSGSIYGIGEVPPTTEDWRARIAEAIAKHGAQWLLNELSGEHADPVPEINTPKGADA